MSEEFLRDSVILSLQAQGSSSFDGDGIWVLLAGFFVFFMHAGFSMLEAGSIEFRHHVNVLFKNVGTVVFGGVAYFLIGYSFAYGNAENNSFLGTGFYAGDGFQQNVLTGDTDRVDFFFQFAFCVTAATIISGAVAGRIKLEAYLAIAVYVTAFVYPVVSHWVWSDSGWLSAFKSDSDVNVYLFSDQYDFACGVFDFAGSGVVHLTGGTAAFISAIVLGPRTGRFTKEGTVTDMPGHNLAICTLGTLILWFGWYGFNCGSTLAFFGAGASKVAVTTSIAPAAACITSIILQRLRTGVYDLPGALNAILAGLVSITAGCSIVSDYAAIPIGVVGALIYTFGSELLLKMKIDDPIGASPVHGLCGIWGVLAVGIFATPEFVALSYSCPVNPPEGDLPNFDPLPGFQFLQQVILVVSVIGWVALTLTPFLFLLKFTGMLRVGEEEELIGLDKGEHGIEDDEETFEVEDDEKKVVDVKVDEEEEAVAEEEAQAAEDPKVVKKEDGSAEEGA